jgi:sialate O-acetylesterase
MKKLNFILLFFVFFAISVQAKIDLSPLFSDNMVLQQSSSVKIWGKATPKHTVILKTGWDDKEYRAEVKTDSTWQITVTTPKASFTEYNITISEDKDSRIIHNVLIGEVWLCMGQSNMEMPMNGYPYQPVENSLTDIVQSKNQNIRSFKVKRTRTTVKQEKVQGTWEIASPQTTGEFSATGYYFARMLNKALNIPVGFINSSWGGTPIQTWMSEEALLPFPQFKAPASDDEIKSNNRNPAVLFNSMVYGLVGFSMKGIIWYQGEANRQEYEIYPEMFLSFYNDLNKKWNIGNFPIYYCQIAPYQYSGSDLVESALMREAMGKIEEMDQSTGMAVLMDTGIEDCIHPSQKSKAGERLAFIALGKTYGYDNLRYQSPKFKSASFEPYKALVSFENLNSGLTSFGEEISGFEMAGDDKKFYPAQAKISKNKNFSLEITCDSVKNPKSVRYAFKNYTKANLFGSNGLPVSSFRSDDW